MLGRQTLEGFAIPLSTVEVESNVDVLISVRNQEAQLGVISEG